MTTDDVTMSISVPPEHRDVLDALAERARELSARACARARWPAPRGSSETLRYDERRVLLAAPDPQSGPEGAAEDPTPGSGTQVVVRPEDAPHWRTILRTAVRRRTPPPGDLAVTDPDQPAGPAPAAGAGRWPPAGGQQPSGPFDGEPTQQLPSSDPNATPHDAWGSAPGGGQGTGQGGYGAAASSGSGYGAPQEGYGAAPQGGCPAPPRRAGTAPRRAGTADRPPAATARPPAVRGSRAPTAWRWRR